MLLLFFNFGFQQFEYDMPRYDFLNLIHPAWCSLSHLNLLFGVMNIGKSSPLFPKIFFPASSSLLLLEFQLYVFILFDIAHSTWILCVVFVCSFSVFISF